MAFTTIPDSLIQVGKSITRTLWKTYVKDNLDDHEDRINAVEGSANKIVIWDEVVRNAATLSNGGTITGLDVYIAAANFTLIDAKVYIFEKGSLTGNLEIDFKKSSSSDFTSAVSVFTTKPKIDYSTASDYEESANTVFDNSTKDLAEGDYLRFDVTSMPGGGTLGKFGIILIGEAT